MPFRDRVKQLLYMRRYARERRELIKKVRAEEKRRQYLTKKMIYYAREVLRERHNHPIEAIPNDKGGFLLEKTFVIASSESLRLATKAVCNAEDEVINSSKDIKKIGIIDDLQISFLNDKHGIVWERLKPLS